MPSCPPSYTPRSEHIVRPKTTRAYLADLELRHLLDIRVGTECGREELGEGLEVNLCAMRMLNPENSIVN